MTMKFSKKLFIVVAVTFLSIVSSFLFMQSPSIAKASTEPTFSVTGAQIRESDPAGIRFVTNVPKTLYNDSLKFGTLLLPSKMLQENQTITLENYESLDVWKTHSGVDIVINSQESVKAVLNGKVIGIYQDNVLGTSVVIEGEEYTCKYQV